MSSYFREQFKSMPTMIQGMVGKSLIEQPDKKSPPINGILILAKAWSRSEIRAVAPYTVNFLAYTIWEAISMYNHVTNNWGDREHLMPVDPIYPETQKFILGYLDRCFKNIQDQVVAYIMFYNSCSELNRDEAQLASVRP